MKTLLAILALCGGLGWANVNPSGDIQAYTPGGAAGNSNVITGDFTVNGNQTISGRLTTGNIVNNGNTVVGSAVTNYQQWASGSRVLSPSDGAFQLTKSDGTFASLLFGAAGATTGIKLVPANGILTLYPGDQSAGAATLAINVLAGQIAINTLGQATLGEAQITRTTGDALRLTSTVNARLSNDGQLGWASGNGGSTARDVSFYRSSAGVIGVNNGSGTSPNGDLTLNNLTTGTTPALGSVNPQMYYRYDECDNYNTLSQFFSVNGSTNANTNSTPMGQVTSPSNHPGVLAVAMTSSAAGGAITGFIDGFYKKSASITWRWRVAFQMPTVASSAGNRYVFNVGSFNYNATAPWAGQYISYSDNVNSGNWVLNSSVGAGTITSANSSTAAPAAGTWHVLATTLVNGVFTYVLDGTTLGTVTDTNVTTSDNWVTYSGSIQIIPSSFTTNTYAFMDSYDILVTGISR